VLKAAIDAETLTDALKTTGDVVAGLKRYEELRQPYGASLVARGRHIGAAVVARNADAATRAETLLREYGSAGVVRNQAIAARVPV
jgi:2-polyprenyl-6-methoxyphenol hydroxylase-like FAD-dependent oxidoreductase